MFKLINFCLVAFSSLLIQNYALGQEGRILLEYWNGLSSNSVASLTSLSTYPKKPSGRAYLNTFEAPSNVSDNYGSLIHGYITAPSSGSYTFWIAGDDKCQLWLSTDANPLNKRLILEPTGTSLPREWTKSTTQKSSPITLTAGVKYYIEAIHIESTGNDNLAVGWTLQNGTLERPIPAHRLSPFETVNAVPAESEIFANLSGHPRIQASSRDFHRMKQTVLSTLTVKYWNKNIKSKGESFLTTPVSTYSKPDGVRLLSVSRAVLERVIFLTYLYNTDPDPAAAARYANRAWLEMEAAAKFPDWNPSHFLDIGEMSYAFALGYDRLYHYLTPTQRTFLKNAIVKHAFMPFISAHNNQEWWTVNNNNWNYVCNGGVGLCALSLGNDAAESAKVLLLATNSIKNYSINSFGPDGGWEEGPMYWGYSLKYLIAFLSGLESAEGGDFGLGETPGIAQAGSFPIYLTGPKSELFNFGDGIPSIKSVDESSMFYLAQKYNKHEYCWFQREVVKGVTPYNIIWYNTNQKDPKTMNYPLDKLFSRVGVGSMRSAWSDTMAAFVAFKAGNNASGHSNLDNGSFVFDALGKRWACDLGADNYNLPGIFGERRCEYYKVRAEGQNTIVLNPTALPEQEKSGSGKITSSGFNTATPSMKVDMSTIYAASGALKMIRTVKFENRRNLLIQDEIQTSAVSQGWWFMHTLANIQVSGDGKSALLTIGDQKLNATIVGGPADAKFSVMDARPLPTSPKPAGQDLNVGIRKLAIKLNNITTTTVTVLLAPVYNTPAPAFVYYEQDETQIEDTLMSTSSSLESNFSLYPNPVKDKLFIQLDNPASENVTIYISDITGKNIMSADFQLINNHLMEINTSTFNPGFYTLNIQEGNKMRMKKFILHR